MANMGSLIPIKSAGCGQLAQGFHNQNRLEDEFHIKKGDIVFFNWDNGRTPSSFVPFPSVDHTGIVVEVGSNGNFKSIEGNTGNTSNGEVLLQSRNIKDVSCVAHPNYTSTMTADMVIATAKAEVGTKATSVKKCKYNTWFYGSEVSGDMYDWCAVFVCWCFYHTETKSADKYDMSNWCTSKIIMEKIWKTSTKNRAGQVMTLQRILNELLDGQGYRGKDGNKLTVDGVFGDNTEYALMQYQKNHGLTVDGICGYPDWSALLCEYK